MLPLFLHFGVHDEKGVVREVDRNLPLRIGKGPVFLAILLIFSKDLSHPEFSGNSQTQTADNSAGPKIGKLI